MEDLLTQNLTHVTNATDRVTEHVHRRRWTKQLGTWTLLLLILATFCATFLMIRVVPKRQRGRAANYSWKSGASYKYSSTTERTYWKESQKDLSTFATTTRDASSPSYATCQYYSDDTTECSESNADHDHDCYREMTERDRMVAAEQKYVAQLMLEKKRQRIAARIKEAEAQERREEDMESDTDEEEEEEGLGEERVDDQGRDEDGEGRIEAERDLMGDSHTEQYMDEYCRVETEPAQLELEKEERDEIQSQQEFIDAAQARRSLVGENNVEITSPEATQQPMEDLLGQKDDESGIHHVEEELPAHNVHENDLQQRRKLNTHELKRLLRVAAARGDVSAVLEIRDVCIEQNIINSVDDNGWTALHEAVRSGNTEVVDILFKAGADVNRRTNFGQGGSPLWWAIDIHGEGHSVVSVLRRNGAIVLIPE